MVETNLNHLIIRQGFGQKENKKKIPAMKMEKYEKFWRRNYKMIFDN